MLFRSSAMPTKSKKTIIRSFRISEESFNILEEEAALLNVSVNTLVDQIIGVHTSYERFMKKFGMMTMARSTFRRLLEILPEDRVAQAAKAAHEGDGQNCNYCKIRRAESDESAQRPFPNDDIWRMGGVPRNGIKRIQASHHPDAPYGAKWVDLSVQFCEDPL